MDEQERGQHSSSTASDHLLNCLSMMVQLHNKHFSKEALLTGLPLTNNRLTPSLFIRAAERIGFAAKIVERPLSKLTNLVLPAVLILNNNQCCILVKWLTPERAEIILPDMDIKTSTEKSFAELEQTYGGFAILMQPVALPTEAADTPPAKQRSWFWGTLWHYRAAYTEVLVAAFFINLFGLAAPLFIMNVYDRVVPNNALVTLWTLTIGILIIFSFDLILRFLRSYLVDVVGKRADIVMASILFQQIITMELRNKPKSVGSFANNLHEFETLREFFTSATLTTFVDLPFLIIYIVLIGYIGYYIVLAPITVIVVVLAIGWAVQTRLHATIQKYTQSTAQKHAIMVESLTGLEAIKYMGAEGLIQRKWEQAASANAVIGLKSRFLSGTVTHITYYFQQILTVAIVIIGVYEIQAGLLTLGGLIACTILAGRTMAPFSQLIALLTRYQQAKFALHSLNNLMSLPTEQATGKKYLHHDTVKGDIEFQQVSFHYPGQEHTKALKNVSLKIKAGEHVAILGPIGSGKSTLQKLLLGLYHPQTGSIYIDNMDITQLDPTILRRNIGYVPQDVLLFSGTVLDNIVMSQPWAEDKAVLNAAHIAGVDIFTSHHPLGLNIPVGERGEGLSGGQRQTIAIARALLQNPPLLLFDEPSSSMDQRLEMVWIERLKNYIAGKTLILVTHKTSLLSMVDRLIILDNGKVVIDGPKEQVIQQLQQARQSKT